MIKARSHSHFSQGKKSIPKQYLKRFVPFRNLKLILNKDSRNSRKLDLS